MITKLVAGRAAAIVASGLTVVTVHMMRRSHPIAVEVVRVGVSG
ncbi:MAG: hypothetical protein AB7U49_06005 [Hyphomicrobiaceae bacterium]